jgi:FkbM family methyltransferase
MARKWRRLRRPSKFVNYIVTDHAGALEPFYRVELRARDISSIEKPVLDPGGGTVQSEEILVPTITLTKLLDDNGVSKIDFLSMDIEGAEPLALAGFDIDRFQPQLVCIEAKVVNREKIAQYFKRHRYHQIERYLQHDRTNWYFVPNARR